jgi:hypothetical protein
VLTTPHEDTMLAPATPTITKPMAQQIIASGMTVSLPGLQAAALFWALDEERAGRIVRFVCEMTGTTRLLAA